jgi:hypothetical protein
MTSFSSKQVKCRRSRLARALSGPHSCRCGSPSPLPGFCIAPYTPGALSFLLPSGPLSFFEFPCPSNRGRFRVTHQGREDRRLLVSRLPTYIIENSLKTPDARRSCHGSQTAYGSLFSENVKVLLLICRAKLLLNSHRELKKRQPAGSNERRQSSVQRGRRGYRQFKSKLGQDSQSSILDNQRLVVTKLLVHAWEKFDDVSLNCAAFSRESENQHRL